MKQNIDPFNIDLLILNDEQVKQIAQIKVLDTMDGATKNFHPKGLFSTDIFGKLGEESRLRKFAYVDLKVDILHPIIYQTLGSLKRLYLEILQGKTYAVWNETLKDFERSTPMEGQTGYYFFLQHWKDIKFEERDSTKRILNLKLMEKYKDKAFLNKWLVLPAGFRDFEIDDNGQPSEDEINNLYRKMISSSFLVDDNSIKISPELLNNVRLNIQNASNDVYNYIINLLEGKKKFILGKWASRKIFNGTRNVITAPISKVDYLFDPRTQKSTETIVGLFQYLKAILPAAIHQVRNSILNKIFVGPNEPAWLVNNKTLKREQVTIEPEIYDDWMSNEGIERMINRYGEEELRHEPLTYKNYYFALIYKGPDNTYKLFNDIDELPEGKNKEDVYPLTFTELFYLSVYKHVDKFAALVTRYPILGLGGIYPSMIQLRTTTKYETRTELNSNWEKTESTSYFFPIKEERFYNSMAPHSKHVTMLGADYDGDVCSFNVVYSDEAVEEIKSLLNKRDFYINVDGSLLYSANVDSVSVVVNFLNG